MSARILIAYTSRKGSTAEIAQAIGKELQSAGHPVNITDMKTVSTVEGSDAVVIGTPVYMGHIVKDVKIFVTQHRDGLAKIPVAAFAVGIAPVAPHVEPVDKILDDLKRALSPVQLAASTVFAGRLDPERMTFFERQMTRLLNVKTGDFRDWGAIKIWARELPALLKV